MNDVAVMEEDSAACRDIIFIAKLASNFAFGIENDLEIEEFTKRLF